MTDYPITTEVKIGGTDAYVLASDLAAGQPTVLDGLSVSWGRDSTVDQPDAGTCTFTVREQLDLGDQETIFNRVHVGQPVEVWAHAAVPASNSQLMQQTTFQGTNSPLPARLWTHQSGSDTSVANQFSRWGRNAAWFENPRASGTWNGTVVFAPIPFPDEGTAPDAWDGMPRMLPGDQWLIEMHVWIPRGAQVQMQAFAQTAPYKSSSRALCPITGAPVTGNNGWVTFQSSVSLPDSFGASGAWVVPAMKLLGMPAPLQWSQISAAEAWNGTAWDGFTWDDLDRVGVSFVSLVTQGPAVRNALVWAGEITAVSGQAAGDHAVVLDVTASDAATKLANTTISDTPWANETLINRFNKIMTKANAVDLESIVDPGLAGYHLAYRDVDAVPAFDLLQDLAQSVGGVCWVTSHDGIGPYVWIEDPMERMALREFGLVSGTVKIVSASDRAQSFVSANDVLRDPVVWTQDVASVINWIDLTYLTEIPPAAGSGDETTTDTRTVTQKDATSIAKYGVRRLAVDTELTNVTDATNLATRLLTQAQSVTWVVSGYHIDTRLIQRDIGTLDYSDRLNMIMDMLDSTTRIGRAVTLIDLPTYSPPGSVGAGYVEGGNYSVEDQKWQLDLNLSNAGAQGDSATWAEMDDAGSWTWTQMDKSIKWTDAFGVAGPS